MTTNHSHDRWWRQTARITLGTAAGGVALATAALAAARSEIGGKIMEIPLSLAGLTLFLPLALVGLMLAHARRQKKIDRRNDLPEG